MELISSVLNSSITGGTHSGPVGKINMFVKSFNIKLLLDGVVLFYKYTIYNQKLMKKAEKLLYKVRIIVHRWSRCITTINSKLLRELY